MEIFPSSDEPLGLWWREAELRDDLRELRFELSSRGDRVPGRLLLPATAPEPVPLVLLEHGAGAGKEADYIDATARPWVRAGAAVACIDLPLHGERHSGKLTQRLLEGLQTPPLGAPLPRPLWVELVRQTVADLRRALDALAQRPELDPRRVAYAAFSLGSILGACFCGVEPRVRAAALALGGAGFGVPEVDPATWIGRFAPRPLLLVSAERDTRMPRARAEALFEAAGEPKRHVWIDSGHHDLPGSALKTMWGFLREHLEPAPSG